MRFRRPFVWCFALLAGFPGGAFGQSLEEALAAAYSNNPTLMAQRARLRGVDEQLPQALSGWRPSLDLEADSGVRATYSNATFLDKRRQHRDPSSLSLTLSQPLYSGGQTVAEISKAENAIMAERAQLLAVEQYVFLAAVTAYVDVFRDQAVLELNVNNEQVLKRQLEATRDRFMVGEITRTDVHQAEARLARATADRIEAEGRREASRAAFKNVIGIPSGKLAAPKPPMDQPKNVGNAVEAAVTGNPAVISAEYTGKALIDNVVKTRGELLPSIDLSGTASRAFDASSETSRFDSYEALVTLTMPLYQSGSVYSRLREAKQKAAEQRLKIDQARRDATESATRSWEKLQTVRARIDSFRTQIKASEVALEGVEREATVGSRTVLDVLDAEQELLDAKVSLVGAQRDEIVAIFELKEATGTLTARHINLPVDSYDPENHYREVREKWFGGESSGQID